MRAALLAGLLLAAPLALADDGPAIFAARCAACHQADAAGTPGLAPSLASTLGARAARPAGRAYLMQVLLAGMNGPISSQGQQFNGFMPAFGELSDAELAAVLNHVLQQFNGAQLAPGFAPLTAAELASARHAKASVGAARALRAQSEQGAP